MPSKWKTRGLLSSGSLWRCAFTWGCNRQYRRNIQADDIFAKEGVELRPDNWQQLALDWFAPREPEQGELARLGFMSYLLGDFPGELGWFNQAAGRMPYDNPEVAARILYNRGIVCYLVEGDKEGAIADLEKALKRMPDYPQAKEALRGLRGKLRWVPW